MTKTNRAQREALRRVFLRIANSDRHQIEPAPTYRSFRRTVQSGPGCVMVPYCGTWLGIEPDGYTHS